MTKRITVFAGDKYLRQKIYLILSPHHSVRCADIAKLSAKDYSDTDLVIWNLNDKPLPSELSSYAVTLGEGGDIALPFTEKMLLDAVCKSEEKKPENSLILGEKCVHLHGKTIRLTDVEFSLLCALVDAKGGFISREELIQKIWGDSATDGILNVYIHYLREKIEFLGEKIIISSRKLGYKIEEKYLGEGGGR